MTKDAAAVTATATTTQGVS